MDQNCLNLPSAPPSTLHQSLHPALDHFASVVADRTHRQIFSGAPGASLSLDDAQHLVDGWFGTLKPSTRESYRDGLTAFQAHVKALSHAEAAQKLLALNQGDMNAAVLEYRAMLSAQGAAPATVALRLSALRGLARHARRIGIAAAAVEVASPKVTNAKDMRGPSSETVDAVLERLERSSKAVNVRNRALVGLYFFCGLRNSEACNLDWPADVDLQSSEIRVLGKGQETKQTLSIPVRVQAALSDWIQVRGDSPGPLICTVRRLRTGNLRRLGRRDAFRVIRSLGLKRPHGLRHAAITTALDRTNGNIRAVSRFSRHTNISTTMRYDDARKDFSKEIGNVLAGEQATQAVQQTAQPEASTPAPRTPKRRPPGPKLAHRIPQKRRAGVPILCPVCKKDAFVYAVKWAGPSLRKRHYSCGTCLHRFKRVEAWASVAGQPVPPNLAWSVDRLLSDEPAQVTWLWRTYLARRAVSLLAAPPKAGKSTLVLSLLHALMTGREFLGSQLEKQDGAILVFTEEPKATIREKCAAWQDHALPLQFVFKADCSPGWPAMVDTARTFLAHQKHTLLVIDTAAAWGMPEANPRGIEDSYSAVKTLAAAHDVAVLMLHHTKKGAQNGLESIRGHSALVGAADICLKLRRAGGQTRCISGAGRFAEAPLRLSYRLNNGQLERSMG